MRFSFHPDRTAVRYTCILWGAFRTFAADSDAADVGKALHERSTPEHRRFRPT
ncbi:MAG: hypothetical protein IJ265_07115 [Oscillospiraceae bacterium]|nr:hypothetical protein [Oscillospiraceae bacterium]